MTKLDRLKNQYRRALERLGEVLREEPSPLVRDAAIKRFEFTFDLAWKLIRALLEEQKGITCRAPKECIRLAYQQGLIEYDDLWIRMTDLRNRIVHEYSEEFSDEIYAALPEIYRLFGQLDVD